MEPDAKQHWQNHIEQELARVRDSQHRLREDVNAMNLRLVAQIAELKDKVIEEELMRVKDLAELKLSFQTAVAEIKSVLLTKQTKTDAWATIGSTVVAAVPAVAMVVWVILQHLWK